jgi:hypothetical protein
MIVKLITAVASFLTRAILVLALFSSPAFCGDADARRVVVGVGERFSAKQQIRRTLTSPKGQLHYLAEHKAATDGALPPDWLLKWVSADLATHGYIPAKTARATLWLTFEWGPLDPEISHFGSPAQRIDVRGRKILDGPQPKRDRGETTPFCTVTAFDIAELLKPFAERTPLWHAKMWPIFIATRPTEKVEIGPLIFKEYVDLDPPRAKIP